MAALTWRTRGKSARSAWSATSRRAGSTSASASSSPRLPLDTGFGSRGAWSMANAKDDQRTDVGQGDHRGEERVWLPLAAGCVGNDETDERDDPGDAERHRA